MMNNKENNERFVLTNINEIYDNYEDKLLDNENIVKSLNNYITLLETGLDFEKGLLERIRSLKKENESLKAYNRFLVDEKMLLIKEKAELKEKIRDESYTTIIPYKKSFLKQMKETSKQESKIVEDVDDLFK